MATTAATRLRQKSGVADLGLRNGDISGAIGAALQSAF
jgi:hypothetical protein